MLKQAASGGDPGVEIEGNSGERDWIVFGGQDFTG
jgi:hypothetical protein